MKFFLYEKGRGQILELLSTFACMCIMFFSYLISVRVASTPMTPSPVIWFCQIFNSCLYQFWSPCSMSSHR